MTTSSNAKLLIQQIEVYNMSELVHAALHDEDFDHYGVKGMKWYQHIFGDKKKSSGGKSSGESDTPKPKKEPRLKIRQERFRNKYTNVKDVDQRSPGDLARYVRSVKQGYKLRKAKTLAKRIAVTGILSAAIFAGGVTAGAAIAPWSSLDAVLGYGGAATTAATGAIYNKIAKTPYRKTAQEREASKVWKEMKEEEKKGYRWSDAAYGEEIIHSAINHYGRKGMKWYQHIFTSDKADRVGSAFGKVNRTGEAIADAINKPINEAAGKLYRAVTPPGRVRAFANSVGNAVYSYAGRTLDRAASPFVVEAAQRHKGNINERKFVSNAVKDNKASTAFKELTRYHKPDAKEVKRARSEAAKISTEYLRKVHEATKGTVGAARDKAKMRMLVKGIEAAMNEVQRKRSRDAAIMAIGLSDAYSTVLSKYAALARPIDDNDLKTFGPMWSGISDGENLMDLGIALGWYD